MMIGLALAAITYVRAYIVSRHRLGLEIAALRQQLVVFKRKRPRPLLRNLDRLFWVGLRQWWTGWASALMIVRAETVVSWHRADSDCSGACDPDHSVDRRSVTRSRNSSAA
jgi:hypothetical protein